MQSEGSQLTISATGSSIDDGKYTEEEMLQYGHAIRKERGRIKIGVARRATAIRHAAGSFGDGHYCRMRLEPVKAQAARFRQRDACRHAAANAPVARGADISRASTFNCGGT